MGGVWSELAPFVLGSMVVPAPLLVTLLLLRSSRWTAAAWLAGMTVARLAQGAIFGVVLTDTSGGADSPAWRDATVAVVLLVVAVLLFTTAAKQLVAGDDPDAPPPRWMAMIDSVRPGKAFAFGVGFLAVSVKFWVFTLGAISVIQEAEVGQRAGIATYVAFALLAILPQLLALGAMLVAPGPSRSFVDGCVDWLRHNNRIVVTVVGFVFGTWFLVKALVDLGVI